jgi:uncharacterized cupredoxin-like copper-binding protein
VKPTLIAAPILALVTAACGGGGEDNPAMEAPPAKAVEIKMVDMAFQPTTFSAQRGERVEFVFRNEGQLPHDAFIGDSAAQADHESKMRQKEGSGGGGHDMKDGDKDKDAVTVEPGKTERLTYTFERTGTVEIGCHQPGHYAAGMKVAVTVA